MRLPRRLASALLIAVGMTGCGGSETPGLVTNNDLLRDLPRVENSTKLPCRTQQQIAAQNSALDTILDGTEKVYKPPLPECDKAPKQQTAKVL